MSDFSDDGLDVVVDGTDISEEDLKHASATVSKEGHYHVMVQSVTPYNDEGRLPSRRVDMVVLDGTEKSQIGRYLNHYCVVQSWEFAGEEKTGKILPLNQRGKILLAKMFCAFGLLDQNAIRKKNLSFPFSQLVGCQAIVRVYANEFVRRDGEKGTGYRIGSFHAIDDPKVGHVPKDADGIASWEQERSVGSGTGFDDI